jgi:hypothetical protein
MIYCDFGQDVVVSVLNANTVVARKLKRYTAFTRYLPTQALYKAHSIVAERDGRIYWEKNRYGNEGKDLTAEELEQFMWQKLSSEMR